MKKVFLLFYLCLFLSSPFSFSQETAAATKTSVSDKLKTLFNGKTQIENPFDLRDPFRRTGKTSGKESDKNEAQEESGIYTNLKSLPTGENLTIKVAGVLIGKERRALLRFGDSPEVYIVSEQKEPGEGGSYLKAILPGGVIVVEKIVNVYGEEEYLETVIPISQ